MRTKNFFKGLAVAAVALVGVFATSCSEEELNFNGKPSTPVTPDPVVLPDGVAYAAISVVDLGDLGLGSQVLTTEMKDVTGLAGLDGTEIECPDFDDMEDYVIPAAQKISVPTLSKCQTITIPMTFYVVKKESAFAQVEWDIENPKSWGNTEEGTPYVYSKETWKGTEEEDLQNLSNYWKDIKVEYSVPLIHFVSVLGETDVAPAAKAAATTAEEIVAAYVKNIVMPEYGVEGDSYTQIAGPVTLFSGGCVDFTKTIYSTHPTYVFTYMGEEVEVTFEQIMYAFGVLGTPYAIPGHETEYSHSKGHGHYQHDKHGNDMNAGGGIVSFE